MRTRGSLVLVSLGLVATLSTNNGMAFEVPEVSGLPAGVGPGEERRTNRLRNGTPVAQTGRLIDGDRTLEIVRDNGCRVTRSVEDIYSPNLTWTNCGKGVWGSGKAIDIRKKGQLWPLKVGNKVEYERDHDNRCGPIHVI